MVDLLTLIMLWMIILMLLEIEDRLPKTEEEKAKESYPDLWNRHYPNATKKVHWCKHIYGSPECIAEQEKDEMTDEHRR